MNYSTFKAMVTDHLNRQDLTSQIDTFALLAVTKLQRKKLYFLQDAATLPTTASTSYVSLPTDFIQENMVSFNPKSALMVNSTGAWLEKMSHDEILQGQISASTGNPVAYAIISNRIELYPIPDGIYSLQFFYFKNLGLPGVNQSNEWTAIGFDVLFQATLAEAWDFLGNTDELLKADTKMQRLLNQLMAVSGKAAGIGQIRYREV